MGYEGGNVPKEMADCAMADILSTIIIRRAAFVFVVSKDLNLCFLFFRRLLVKLDERIFPREENEREKSTTTRTHIHQPAQ